MTAGETLWDRQRGVIHSRKGGWIIGEGVYYGRYSLLDDLVGRVSYFQTLLLAVLDELPERRIADWVEAVYQCMSYPDPRIWCNHIGSLSGAVRSSSVAGVSAGILASDSSTYGPGVVMAEVYELYRHGLMQKEKDGELLPQVLRDCARRRGKRFIVSGFGRPLATGDERIATMERVSKGLGLEAGPHLTFAYEVERYLLETQGESLNLTGYVVAVMMDFGWTLLQIQQTCSIIVTSGVAACHSEAYDKPPESFLPLHCEDIEYRGHAPRPVPEVGEEGGD
ncbi:MAG: hypothetical protein L3J88_00720 [Gammaproteobacteria bacterium]|nr:hypothetical protein [Gammaproteobacteria bacterium]MCF6361891.1 hypothetical protein [Gammaproteobacteria bacterium]